MIHLFYFVGIIYLIRELLCLFNMDNDIKKIYRFYELKKYNEDLKWDEMSEEYKQIILNKIPVLFLFIWLFIGLMTFNWFLFLLFLAIIFIIFSPISKILRYSSAYKLYYVISTITSIFFSLLVIINHYHLRIDFFQLFKNMF